jgi:hypothetical protein
VIGTAPRRLVETAPDAAGRHRRDDADEADGEQEQEQVHARIVPRAAAVLRR